MRLIWKRLPKRRGGFTLIELMIVVAIIGLLAAIAIPNFIRFQLRAKSAEGKGNLAAIRTAEESYFAEYSAYVVAPITPATVPGVSKAPFMIPMAGQGFDQVGWAPEGNVYFSYEVVSANPSGTMAEFAAGAQANIDGDMVNQSWGYIKPPTGTTTGTAPTGCMATGTYNAVTMAEDLLTQVGPCDAVSGQSVF